MVLISRPKLVLLDIEGTTTSISFVKQSLFPYVRTNLSQFLHQNWNELQLKEDIDLLRRQSHEDLASGLTDVPLIVDNMTDCQLAIKSIIDNVFWQMDCDRKTTALKQLQGNIWRFGYENGDIKGHVYSDVPKALQKWKNEFNLKICIYSSGSIFAQKLLFGNSVYGDLTPFIDNYFDTTYGPKIDSKSYSNIAKSVDIEPEHILFITDIVKEAIAAKSVGINTLLSVREGNEPLTQEDMKHFQFVSSFDEIQFK